MDLQASLTHEHALGIELVCMEGIYCRLKVGCRLWGHTESDMIEAT